VILAILIVASGQIRKNCPARCAFAQLTTALPGGDRDLSRCSPLDTDCNLPRLNRYITRHLTVLTTMVRQVPRVNPSADPVLQVRGLQEHRAKAGRYGGVEGSSGASNTGEYTVTADRRSHQGRKAGTVIPVRMLAKRRGP
jgi:hypothetical protein